MVSIKKYKGFDIYYENGEWYAQRVKGTEKIITEKRNNEGAVINDIDKYVAEEMKLKEKPVLIRKYEGYLIKYRVGMFFVEKDGKAVNDTKYGEERLAVNWIDTELSKEKTEKEKAQKIKETQELNKHLEKAEYQVEAQELKKMITRVSHFLKEGYLTFEKGKVSLTGMDAANAMMVHGEASYKGQGAKVVVPLNILNLRQFLAKAIQNEKSIGIKFRVAETVKLIVHNGFGLFELPTVEIDEKESKVPELKFHTKIVMSKTEYVRMIELADVVAESIVFKTEKQKFMVEAQGDLAVFRNDVWKSTGEDAQSKYSVEYLKAKFFTEKGDLTLQFNKDYPLKVSDEKGNWIILAPRVETG